MVNTETCDMAEATPEPGRTAGLSEAVRDPMLDGKLDARDKGSETLGCVVRSGCRPSNDDKPAGAGAASPPLPLPNRDAP